MVPELSDYAETIIATDNRPLKQSKKPPIIGDERYAIIGLGLFVIGCLIVPVLLSDLCGPFLATLSVPIILAIALSNIRR